MIKNLKIIFTLSLVVFFGRAFGQLDTLNYVKQFEINKVNYIGQPFSKLLNDMTQIQPKTVWNKPPWSNKTIVLDSRFKFCAMESSFNNATITLLIKWQSPIPHSQTEQLEQMNHFYFTNAEKNFYGNKIIKDIMVYRW